jgi:hypothetical protein
MLKTCLHITTSGGLKEYGGDEVISLSHVAGIIPHTLRKVTRISFIVFQYPALA